MRTKLLIITLGLMLCLTACEEVDPNEATEVTTEAVTEVTTEATTAEEATIEDPVKALISAAKEASENGIGEGEKIIDVAFKDKDLKITVDLSGADTSMLTADMIAELRVGSITDEVLNLDDAYYDMWDTITLDFGSEGKITLDKSAVTDDGYGKYFNVDAFELK